MGGRRVAGGDDGDERRELFGREVALDDPEHGLPNRFERLIGWGVVAHRGMFPCFLGGRVWRLVRSIRSDLMTSARVSFGSMTAST